MVSQNVRILSQNTVMDMIQENSAIKVYINATEIEVTPAGIQYPLKTKDDSFIYRYVVVFLRRTMFKQKPNKQ